MGQNGFESSQVLLFLYLNILIKTYVILQKNKNRKRKNKKNK
jgi:hypothetical protein